MFIKKSPNSHGFVNPRDIEQIWRDQFDWVYREMDYAVFPITIHPDVSGRPQVLMMLERLYAHMIRHPGVKFVTMNEMADDFARRFPRARSSGRHMCSLCGVLGGNEHWADAVARPGVYTRNASAIERRRERANRVRIANRILAQFGMTLSDWQGTCVPVVDAHRQDRDHRGSRAFVAGGRTACRPRLRSAGTAGDRAPGAAPWLRRFPPSRRSICSPAFSVPARRHCCGVCWPIRRCPEPPC